MRSVISDDDILVAASTHGGAHTCCTIGLISFSRSGWKFLSFNRWWRLLSSCSNSRHKSPLSSKALYHRTILHLSGSRFFSFCRLAIYGHRCQIDNYQIECFSSIAAWYHCAYKHSLWPAELFCCLPQEMPPSDENVWSIWVPPSLCHSPLCTLRLFQRCHVPKRIPPEKGWVLK